MSSPQNLFLQTLQDREVELPGVACDYSQEIRNANVERSYIIAMTGRSGSTWLASALKQIGSFGNPVEYFSEEAVPHYGGIRGPEDFASYFERVVGTYSSDGCFGFKTNAIRLFWLGEVVDLESTFPASRCAWIDMRRWNIVKQAFSFARAKHSGLWHVFLDRNQTQDSSGQPEIELEDGEIWKEINLIIRQEHLLDEFYKKAQLDPLRINYEEILDSKHQLLMRVCRHIDSSFVFDDRIDNLVDGTQKLGAMGRDVAEERFIDRNSDLLEALYSSRGDKAVLDIIKSAMKESSGTGIEPGE